MSEQLQSVFFSKDTISELNKILLQQPKYQHLTRDGKRELINILVKNMKSIFRSIDLTKLSRQNIDSVFEQLKIHSINETHDELVKTNILDNYLESSADLKFNRDFKSKPTAGNKFIDRPEFTKISINPSSLNQRIKEVEHKRHEQRLNNDTITGFSNDTTSTSLDQMFRPIVENIDDQQFVNNYDNGQKTQDITTKIKNIQEMRQSEIPTKKKRPPTPDLLKSKKTNPDRNNEPQQSVRQSGDKPDFKTTDSSNFNQGFQGLSNDFGGDNLCSLDNIDRPLVDMEITEDTSCFEDRLKRLQSDRNNIKQPPQQGTIDFAGTDFPKSKMSNVLTPISRQEQSRQEQKKKELETQRAILIKQAENAKKAKLTPKISPLPADKFNSFKNTIQSMNNDIKDDTYKVNQMTLLIEKLEKENEELRNGSSMDKMIIVKQQIAEEFDQLKIASEDIEVKQNALILRETELIKKDAELKRMISQYDYLFNQEQLQMEVFSHDNKSKYTWNMQPIANVIGIKLISYSLPAPKFNIETNKNDLIILLINGEELRIRILAGKYSIDDLLDTITNQSNQTIKMYLNNQQKVIIEAVNSDIKFDIKPTILSTNNLGFLLSAENKNNYISDKVWDLRINDKVYLYLTNLSDSMPFGVLHFNGKSECQFKFTQPFDLNKLDILFKDSDGFEYNFNDLPHNLSFLIEKQILHP
jgi:hypothetical protein